MTNTQTPSWPWPRIIAHRGGGTLAPENTLAAVRAGHAAGFRMVEFDVQPSADGVPILLHDDDISRTSSGRGRAADMSIAALLAHDFGAWHSPRYAGEPIATLASVAAFTIANGMSSNIEIKPAPGQQVRTGELVARAAQHLWAAAPLPPLLSSFSEAALMAAGVHVPALPRALLIEGGLPADWRERLARLGCMALHMDSVHITAALVQLVHSAGFCLAAWTVNDMNQAQALLEQGCDAIFTDCAAAATPGLRAAP